VRGGRRVCKVQGNGRVGWKRATKEGAKPGISEGSSSGKPTTLPHPPPSVTAYSADGGQQEQQEAGWS
jgi:hypothetical protein